MRGLVPTFVLALAFGPTVLTGCGGPDPETSTPKVAEKWMSRATSSYRAGDVDDATVAIEGALKVAPKDPQVRTLAGRIALARLDYANAFKLTEGVEGSDAKSIRGRALWYSGDIERAADELEDMLRDPQVKDPWARDVAKLARRGHGRTPFAIEGGLVAAVEMPQAGPALVVPCELEGERIFALVATNFGELMIDSANRKEPAWVNLRFGERLEVKDVPALTTDLSSVSRQLGGLPIKALLGVNVLRHMHVTFDRHGSQFVVRKAEPLAPPDATRLPVFYARGGAMMLRGSIANNQDGQALLFVDSSAFYPLALEDASLKRSGANLSTFQPQPGAPANWKMGPLPYFKLGGMDLSQFPAVQGPTITEYKQTFDVDLNGVVGAGLLSIFRVTFAEEGRSIWVELDPAVMQQQQGGPPEPPAHGGPGAAPPGPQGPPAPPGAGKPETPKLTPPKAEPPKLTPPKAEPPKAEPPKSEGPKAPTPGAKTESKGAAK